MCVCLNALPQLIDFVIRCEASERGAIISIASNRHEQQMDDRSTGYMWLAPFHRNSTHNSLALLDVCEVWSTPVLDVYLPIRELLLALCTYHQRAPKGN